jgi:hypothetical protein
LKLLSGPRFEHCKSLYYIVMSFYYSRCYASLGKSLNLFKPMSRSMVTAAALLLLFLTGLPLAAQPSPPEFNIAVAPSIVTVERGEVAALTVTVTCNTASLKSVADCNARPKFDIYLSDVPGSLHLQAAPGRIGANTIVVSASSVAPTGSFPVQVTVVAGDTAQVQTFAINVRPPQASVAPAVPVVVQQPVAQPSPAGRWEHHMAIAKTPEDFDRMANELGRESWELVSVIARQNRGATEWVGFFKRPAR